ncbi:MAG: type III-B CRISPR module RAMP protein Cmr6 [Deltaproteobacteria bacterium]|nr:type III-B CRISPR module RAMP protein Cmr6 [Deltaproteobacteria bacterium]
MPVAVPAYAGKDVSAAPPGHRFRLYFDGWQDNWHLNKDKKYATLKGSCGLGRDATANVSSLRARQCALAAASGDVLTLDARSTAPLVTGVGMEHPLENGFAFLDPYGLPYLPGSGVKGVIRRAAEELVLFSDDPKGWSVGAVWWLFGFDATSAYLARAEVNDEAAERWRQAYFESLKRDRDLASALIAAHRDALKEEACRDVLERGPEALPGSKACRRIHQAGALEFWDAFIAPAGDRMRVDIMNPHFSHYYQNGGPPSDDGSPNPIFFLAVPAGSELTFHVRFQPGGNVPARVHESWMALVREAFLYALDWLGFGAKTAVGYGRMVLDKEAGDRRRAESEKRETERRRREDEARKAREAEERRQQIESLGPLERLLLELKDCNDNRAHEIFAKELPKLSGEEKGALAIGLREAYIRLGKWTGRQSDKQSTKNRTLESIIGDK